jgi:hypothetical protein
MNNTTLIILYLIYKLATRMGKKTRGLRLDRPCVSTIRPLTRVIVGFRQLYQIVYQVIKCKHSIESTRVVVPTRQFTLLI